MDGAQQQSQQAQQQPQQQPATTVIVAKPQQQQEPQQPASQPQQPAVRTFTQEEVNRMMAKEKGQGRNAVYNELGISPDDEEAIAIVRQLMSGRATENSDVTKLTARVEEAEARAREAEAKLALLEAGVLPDYVEDAMAIAAARGVEDPKEAVKELKPRYPMYFSEPAAKQQPGSGSTGQRGTGATPKASSGTPKQPEKGSMGKRLAAKRSGGKSSYSHWSGKNNG